MNKVIINSHYSKRFKYKRLYKRILAAAIEVTGVVGQSEVSVLIVGDDEMIKYCQQYKKKDQATDVLSFPAEWKKLKELIGYNLLGDIIISFDHVIKQASEYGHSQKREWGYLFAHGMLHLLGYDHERSPEEETQMNKLAEMIMKKVGVDR